MRNLESNQATRCEMVNYKLRAARKAKGWTIEKAAVKIGVSWVTYSRWEKGTQTPYLSTLRDICKAFGKPPKELGFEHLIEEPEETKHVTLPAVSHLLQSEQCPSILRLTND